MKVSGIFLSGMSTVVSVVGVNQEMLREANPDMMVKQWSSSTQTVSDGTDTHMEHHENSMEKESHNTAEKACEKAKDLETVPADAVCKVKDTALGADNREYPCFSDVERAPAGEGAWQATCSEETEQHTRS